MSVGTGVPDCPFVRDLTKASRLALRDPSLHRPALSFLSGSEESRRAIPLEDDNEREAFESLINLKKAPSGRELSAQAD